MPSEPKTLLVEETGDWGVYRVESESDTSKPYMVNLAERIYEGKAYGVCTCTWFSTNANKNFTQSKKHRPYRRDDSGKVVEGCTDCKHISAARSHFNEYIVLPLLARAQQGIER